MANKVLVTGGAGFIGSHCVDALLAGGDRVTVLDLKEKTQAQNLAGVLDDIAYCEGNIRDVARLKRLASEHTHILHLAALVSVPESITHPLESHDTNVTGTLTVFDAARRGGVRRVVYASSAAVYGDTEIIPTQETVSTHPLSPYGLHKLQNEQYARLYTELFGLPTVGLRFFNVFGSRQDPSSPYSGVISIFSKKITEGEVPVVFGDGSATRDFVHVSDVVNACLTALFSEKGGGEVFNVGTGVRTSINDIIRVLEEVTGISVTSDYHNPREGDILHSCASIEKIVDALGYHSDCDFEAGIKEALT